MDQAAARRIGARDAPKRILAAAEELALERGPGNISIEAVALRAGLSKGGVLYHFRTKADLLAALVRSHIEANRCLIDECLAAEAAGPNGLAEALIEAYRRERAGPLPSPSGVLVAVAEHPDFLDPLREHQIEKVSRLRKESADADLATIVFLALEGLKAAHLFGFAALDRDQEDAILGRMTSLLRAAQGTPQDPTA